MIQDLVAPLEPTRRRRAARRRARSSRSRRGSWSAGSRSTSEPGQVRALVAALPAAGESARPAGTADDLRSLILEKLGRSRRPRPTPPSASWPPSTPPAATRSPGPWPTIPAEADLPILVAALDSRDPNTTNLATGALRKIKASPSGPEGLAQPAPARPADRARRAGRCSTTWPPAGPDAAAGRTRASSRTTWPPGKTSIASSSRTAPQPGATERHRGPDLRPAAAHRRTCSAAP